MSDQATCPDCLHPFSSHGHPEGCAWSYNVGLPDPPLCGCPAARTLADDVAAGLHDQPHP